MNEKFDNSFFTGEVSGSVWWNNQQLNDNTDSMTVHKAKSWLNPEI